MNIILVIPPSPDKRKITRFSFCSFEAKGNYLLPPLDFMAITAHLDPTDNISFVDGTCDQLSDDEYYNNISKLKGDMFFFLLSNVCWDSDYNYFQKTVKYFPGIPIFVVGDIFLDEEFREKIILECDGVVFFPYKLDLLKMLHIKNNNNDLFPGVFTKSKQALFDQSQSITLMHENFPHHEIFIKHNYRFPFARHVKFSTIVFAYGCPHRCSYCGFSNMPPAVRPHTSVLKELEFLKSLGIKELFFNDSFFGYYKKESIPLLEEMKKRFNFSWSCFTSHQIYTPELLELMHAAGCHTIIVGIESSSTESLGSYSRRFDKGKLESLITHASKLKISICADFIIGLEDETEEDMWNTINYGLKLPLDFASFNVIVPAPGSSVRENLKKKGIPTSELVNFDALGRSGCIGNKHLSGERILKLRNKAVKKFYLRPSLLFRRLRKTSSWEHFKIQFQEMISILRKVS